MIQDDPLCDPLWPLSLEWREMISSSGGGDCGRLSGTSSHRGPWCLKLEGESGDVNVEKDDKSCWDLLASSPAATPPLVFLQSGCSNALLYIIFFFMFCSHKVSALV